MYKRNGSFGERFTYLRSVLFNGVMFNVTQSSWVERCSCPEGPESSLVSRNAESKKERMRPLLAPLTYCLDNTI